MVAIPPCIINASIIANQRIIVSQEALERIQKQKQHQDVAPDPKNEKKVEKVINKAIKYIVYELQYGSSSSSLGSTETPASMIQHLIDQTTSELEEVEKKT